MTKRYSRFIGLYDQLVSHFPSMRMPPVPSAFTASSMEREEAKASGEYGEDKSSMI